MGFTKKSAMQGSHRRALPKGKYEKIGRKNMTKKHEKRNFLDILGMCKGMRIGVVLAMLGILAMASMATATMNTGVVWTWGYNGYGQLGDGTLTQSPIPIQVSGLTNVINITGGGYHTMALKSGGTVRTWGGNWYGQLGDGTTTQRLTPVLVSSLTNVVKIVGGNSHTVALKSDGTVFTWGGQIMGGIVTQTLTPVQVSGLTNVVDIAAGENSAIALKSDGTVWAWGQNGYGQLGDGTIIEKYNPVQVSGLTNVIKIASGLSHSIALKSDGTVRTWGWNIYGQLGDGTTTQRLTPVQVSGLTNVVDIAGGGYHTLALKSDGTVRTWGYNAVGELGDGTTTMRLTPVQVNGLTNVIKIVGGGFHSIALRSDHTVRVWGNNGNNQLGDGTTIQRLTPVQLNGLVNVIDIAAGMHHTIVLVSATPPPDSTAPVITILGNNPEKVNFGATYTDAGATALDAVDGPVPVTPVSTVNTAAVGTYSVTYTAADSAGNSATATRTVKVVDVTAPVITILGNNPETVNFGATYTDAGATAIDNYDGDLTSAIVKGGLPVDTNVLGAHIVTYDVTDAHSNAAIKVTRTVNVVAASVYSVSGYVLNNLGAGLGGVTVKNGSNIATTGIDGSYSIPGLLNGAYNFSYSKADFGKGYLEVTVSDADVTNAKKTLISLPATRYINGTVIDSEYKTSISGVTVSANSTLLTKTNALGFYSFAVTNGSYDIKATFDIRYYTNITTVSTNGEAVVIQDIEMIKKSTGNITGSVTRCCTMP